MGYGFLPFTPQRGVPGGTILFLIGVAPLFEVFIRPR